MIRELLLRDLSLWTCLWQSSVFAGLGLIAGWLLRQRPARAYQVLLLAMTTAVAVPLLSAVVKHFDLGAFAARPTELSYALPEMPFAIPDTAPDAGAMQPVPPQSMPAGVIEPAPLRIPWQMVLRYGWLAVTLVLLGRLAATFLYGVHLVRHASRVPCDHVQPAVDSAESKLAVSWGLKVRASGRIHSPLVWCWSRPAILLVPDPCNDAQVDWAGVVAHELAHCRRRDHITGLVAELAASLLPWNPLMWLSRRMLIRLGEQACDDWVVASGQSSEDYAESLLHFRPQKQPAFWPAVVSSQGGLAHRIRRILNDACGNPRAGARWVLTLGIATLGISLGVAFAQARPAVSVLTAKAEAQVRTDDTATDLTFGNAANLGPTVNSSTNEFDPSISADELELYFNSARPGGLGQTDLWVATRKTRTDPWSEPVNLGPTVNSPAGDKAPCISADGLSLYFSSDRPGGSGGLDLWVTTRTTKDAAWGAPVNLGRTVNSAADEHSPYISADGLTLHFAEKSERPGGLGKGDIWVTTRKTKQDPWGTPVNLGPIVNSSAWDQAPSISTDGLTLYFDSERGGGSDIWVTTRKKTSDPWGTPIKLSPVVNADWEANPEISRDGSTLYFVSTRWGGVGGVDIWQATLVKSTPESRAQSKLVASLADAVKGGDIEQVRLLLAKGAGVNAKDEQGSTPLHEAAGNGWRDVARLLLEKGANVEAVDASGQTPLHRASRFGSRHICASLLAQGASVKARDNQGNTVLHAALGRQEVDRSLFELLLAKGADVKARNEQGETPLHLASKVRRGASYTQQREEAADVLLAHGAEVDATDKSGRTPLHVAAENGQDKVVGLLLAKGADVKTKAADGTNLLHQAVKSEQPDMVELFLSRGIDVNSAGSDGRTALHLAVAARPAANSININNIVEALIARGADVKARDVRGNTPVQIAVNFSNRKDTVRLLLDKGAEVSTIQIAAYLGDLDAVKGFLERGGTVNAQDGDPLLSPLGAAALGGQKDVAAFLISQGASVNAEQEDGITALHCAAQANFKEVAELLIANGAKVDAKTQLGVMPLHSAASWGAKDVASLLIDRGADVNAEFEWVQKKVRPFDLAVRVGRNDMAKLLIDKGADTVDQDYLLYRACWNQQKDLAEFLIRKGADVNSKDHGGENAPALDAIWGAYAPATTTADVPKLVGILKLLLDNGANPNANDGDWYLLHYAARDAEVTRVLLDKGANPNVVDKTNGQSPLHVAAKKGCKPAVELLVARGADANLKNYDGWTPLALAREQGHNEIVEFLQQHGAKE